MPKQDDENGKPLWLTSIQIGLAALGIVGAGLGTALRLILDGYGHPEFQLFVYNITGGTILLFIFAFAMGLGSSFKCNTFGPQGIGCCDGQTK